MKTNEYCDLKLSDQLERELAQREYEAQGSLDFGIGLTQAVVPAIAAIASVFRRPGADYTVTAHI
jgi:hypothetical protein